MGEAVRLIVKKVGSKSENSVAQIKKPNLSPSTNPPIDCIQFLHRTIGNQAVQRLFKSGIIQAKLKIGQPNDIYEQEADRVADMVMRIPENEAVSYQQSVISKGNESVILMKPG